MRLNTDDTFEEEYINSMHKESDSLLNCMNCSRLFYMMSSYYKSNPYEFVNNYIGNLKWYQKIWFKLYCRYKFSYKYKIVPTTKDIDYRILPNDKFTVSKVEHRKER